MSCIVIVLLRQGDRKHYAEFGRILVQCVQQLGRWHLKDPAWTCVVQHGMADALIANDGFLLDVLRSCHPHS